MKNMKMKIGAKLLITTGIVLLLASIVFSVPAPITDAKECACKTNKEIKKDIIRFASAPTGYKIPDYAPCADFVSWVLKKAGCIGQALDNAPHLVYNLLAYKKGHAVYGNILNKNGEPRPWDAKNALPTHTEKKITLRDINDGVKPADILVFRTTTKYVSHLAIVLDARTINVEIKINGKIQKIRAFKIIFSHAGGCKHGPAIQSMIIAEEPEYQSEIDALNRINQNEYYRKRVLDVVRPSL